MTSADLAALRSDLMRDEGVRLKPYTCTAGKVTIGVGRNLTDKGLSQAEALSLLDHDINECLTDLRGMPWFVVLDPVRQRALVNMRFNLGAAGLQGFKRFLAAMGSHDYVTAKRELIASKWAGQVPARAYRIARAIETGKD